MADYQQQPLPKTRYGHCESYFVESHDDLDRRRRNEMRARDREAKKRIQLTLGEHLAAKASQEFRTEHIQQMELLEVIHALTGSKLPMMLTLSKTETLPDIASIDIQTEIKWYMRPYLLDFLIESHAAFGLLPETLFLAVNLLDRYCSRRVVYKKHYQLVGSATLLIAAKYGDHKDRVPVIKELRGTCCGLYDDDMFLQMEWHVLLTLNWVIGHPTIDQFLQLAVEHHQYDPEVEHMASYIAEIGLFHREFVDKRPSDMARSCLALARCILGRPQEHFSEWAGQFDSTTLMGLAQHLPRASNILQRKYSSAHFSRVAIILDEYLLRSEEDDRQQQASAQAAEAQSSAETTPVVEPEAMTPIRQPTRFITEPLTPPDTPTETDNVPADCVKQSRLPMGGIRPPTPPSFVSTSACAAKPTFPVENPHSLTVFQTGTTQQFASHGLQALPPSACSMETVQQVPMNQEFRQIY